MAQLVWLCPSGDSLAFKNTLLSLKDDGSLAELTTEKISMRVDDDNTLR